MARSHVAVLLLSALALSACGGSNTPRPSSPFTAEHATAFDDAVDLVSDPDVLEGRWYDDWATEVVTRVTSADSVMIVKVDAIREDVTPDGKRAFRLQTSTDRQLSGAPIESPSFNVREDEAGYDSIASNEHRILARSFVAFVKWKVEEHEVVARWHLSPASHAVVETVENAIAHRERLESVRSDARR